jgi:hypothetical protein
VDTDRYLGGAETLIAFVDEKVRPPLAEEKQLSWVQLAVISYFYRSSDTYEGVLFLAREGLGVQGAMLDRSLIEDVIDAHWVTIEGDLAMERMRDYTRWQVHDRIEMSKRHPDFFDETPTTDWEPMTPEETKKFRGRMHKGGGSWTGVKTAKRVEAIEKLWASDYHQAELRFFAEWVQGQNSALLHSGPQALAVMTEQHGEGWRMRQRESSFYVRQALHAAMWAYSQMVTLLLDELELRGKAEFENDVYPAAIQALASG